jgi:hypothetical protein
VSFWGKVVLVSDIDASISDLVSVVFPSHNLGKVEILDILVWTVNCNITHHIPT